MEDKEGKWGVWKEILKESAWCWENMVFKVGKAIQSDFGQILGAGIMCCPKVSRTSFPWLPKECHSGGNMGSEFWSRRVELKVFKGL